MAETLDAQSPNPGDMRDNYDPRPWPQGDAEPPPIGPRHLAGLKCDCDECAE